MRFFIRYRTKWKSELTGLFSKCNILTHSNSRITHIKNVQNPFDTIKPLHHLFELEIVYVKSVLIIWDRMYGSTLCFGYTIIL